VDLESRNGSFVNGVRAEGEQPLADGDVLRLGDTILVFRDAVSGTRASRATDAHSGITVLGRQFAA
jgi:pSer/pThr/pTyr-binding forkhead associated (FHA) protein